MPCTDSTGVAWSSADVEAEMIESGGAYLPRCADDDASTPGRSRWWWFLFAEALWYGSTLVMAFYIATLPLQYGDEGHRMFEAMTYGRRVAAVLTLWGVSAFFLPTLFLNFGGFLPQNRRNAVHFT